MWKEHKRWYVERTTNDIKYFLRGKHYWAVDKPTYRSYGCQSYADLCAQLFIEYMKMVIEDAIEEEVVITLPISKTYIFVSKSPSKKITDYNVWDEDPENYHLALVKIYSNKTFWIPINVNQKYWERMQEKAQEGAYLRSKRIFHD